MQQSDEWFKQRIGKATGSRFKDIIAKIKSGEAAARRNYRAQLVLERLTGSREETYTNAAMQWGNDNEPLARVAYEAKTGLVVVEVDFINHESLMAGVSPDGLVDDEGGIEIKCPYQSAIHLETLKNGMPDEHMAQVQGAMWITGRKWWDFISYDPRFPDAIQLYVQRVERDEKYIGDLEREVIKFLSEVDAELEQILKMTEAAA